MLDSISDVRVFVQVVESDGLSAAARVLGMPANTVSRTLSRLELALGSRLLTRTTRRVNLTEEGRTFYERALELLESASKAEVAVRPSDGLSGTLRIAVRSTTVQFGIVGELTKLLMQHPGLRLQLQVSDGDIDVVGIGLDLALRVGALPDSSLTSRSLGQVTFGLAAARAYLDRTGRPKSPQDLARHECIRALGTRPQTHWSLLGPRGRKATALIGGRLECADVRAQADAIYAGFGIGVIPLGELRRSSTAGILERVLPEWRLEPIPVRVVQPSRHAASARSKAVDAVVELLAAAVARMS